MLVGRLGRNCLTYIEIFGIDLVMLGEIKIFFGDKYALAKEILVDLFTVLLWDEPAISSATGGDILIVSMPI